MQNTNAVMFLILPSVAGIGLVTPPPPPPPVQRPFADVVPTDFPLAAAPSRKVCKSWTVTWFAKKEWHDFIPKQELMNVPLWEHRFVTGTLLEKVAHTVSPKSALLNLTRPNNYTEPLEDCTIAALQIKGKFGGCTDAMALEDRFRAEGKRRLYVLLGEENHGCDTCKGFFSNAPLVFRQYHSDDCAKYGDTVMTIPLGVKDSRDAEGLNKTVPGSKRKYVWSFISNQRNAARNAITEQFKNHHFVEQTDQNVLLTYPGQTRAKEYAAVTCDSKFVLAPRGRHEDGWRLAEAIESGAIPIVTDGGQYFSKYMPKSLTDQFITFGDVERMSDNEWAKGFDEIDALLKDPAALDARQTRLMGAYQDFANQWKTMVAAHVAGLELPLSKDGTVRAGSTRAARRIKRVLRGA